MIVTSIENKTQPNLVAKEMNMAYGLGTYTNGGSNDDNNKQSLEHTL